MPHPPSAAHRRERQDPLVGIARLVLDGTNLLHALRRSPEPPPAATLIGRLRGIIPAPIRIVLVFDGREEGVGTSRLASGLTVRYSGRLPADRLIEQLAGEEPAFTLVVTDDRALARSVRDIGARSIPNHWLTRRLAQPRLSSPAAGRPRPPVPLQPEDIASHPIPTDGSPPSHSGARAGSTPADAARDAAAVADARRWRPGRRATRKRGNPRRGHAEP